MTGIIINDFDGWLEFNKHKIFRISEIENIKIVDDKISSLTISKVNLHKDLTAELKKNLFEKEQAWMSLENFVIKIKQGSEEFTYFNEDEGINLDYPYIKRKIHVELKED